MLAGELCNRDVVFVTKDASIREVVSLMRECHVGDVVVVQERDGSRSPVGIITDRDLVMELLAKEVSLGAVNAGDIMAVDLLTVKASEEVSTVIERMRGRGVRRAPVVDPEGVLVGIISVDDLLDFFAGQLAALATLVAREQKHEREVRK